MTTFYGPPNKQINRYTNRGPRPVVKVCKFDEKGIFTTDDPKLIAFLKKRFKFTEGYEQMKYQELVSLAAERGLYKTGMKKSELIEALTRG